MIGEEFVSIYYKENDLEEYLVKTNRSLYVIKYPSVNSISLDCHSPNLVPVLREFPIQGRMIVEVKHDDIEFGLHIRLSGNWIVQIVLNYDPIENKSHYAPIVSNPDEFIEWEDEFAEMIPVVIE